MKTFTEWVETQEQLDEGFLKNAAIAGGMALGALGGYHAMNTGQTQQQPAPQQAPQQQQARTVILNNNRLDPVTMTQQGNTVTITARIPTSLGAAKGQELVHQKIRQFEKAAEGKVGSTLTFVKRDFQNGQAVYTYQTGDNYTAPNAGKFVN